LPGTAARNAFSRLYFFFIKLRVVNAEDLVELGASPVHFGKVEVIDETVSENWPK